MDMIYMKIGVSAVSKHLKNIFINKELCRNSTTEIFSVVRKEENRNVKNRNF
jgi:hypothetical protein